jgi:hypothetical protein
MRTDDTFSTAAARRRGTRSCSGRRRGCSSSGFPPPGDPFWTTDTYAGITRRYADADLSAFAPHPPTA